jgi:hypothetical protein
VARAPDRTDSGALYFIRGWSGGFGLDEFQLAPYGMKSMSEKGWEVIAAKDHRIQPAMSYDTVPGAAAFTWQRAGELKAPGYKRVVIAGQSWGSCVAMVADQEKNFAVEALWRIVPTSGPRRGANGWPNPSFVLNKSKFAELVPKFTDERSLRESFDQP